jgi:hypothetical protein
MGTGGRGRIGHEAAISRAQAGEGGSGVNHAQVV